MVKKIPVKTLYLLLVISIGLIGLGVGSTYAMFVASAEIDNPISFVSNLTHTSQIIEAASVSVPSNSVVTTTLNITNSDTDVLNYTTWYINKGYDIEVMCENGSSQGTLDSGESVSVVLRVLNNTDEALTVNLGASASDESFVLGSDMFLVQDINVLMSAEKASNDTSLFLSSNLQRGQISSIMFVDNINVPAGNTSVDVSKYADGSIFMWYGNANANGNYDVYIGSDNGITYLDSGYALFYYLTNVVSIDFNNLVDTSITTNMAGMFGYCSSLLSLDVADFDTSKVTKMGMMFGYTKSLTYLNLSNWDVSNVTTMNSMFKIADEFGHMSLVSIGDVSNWDTGSLTNTSQMFAGCSSFKSLDFSNWNTSNVTNMSFMFHQCNDLEEINFANWIVSNVIDFDCMFQFCHSLSDIDISKWNTSSATNMRNMFYGCEQLSNLDLSNFNTSNVTNMKQMFCSCTNLVTIYVSDTFVTTAVTNSSYMFAGCTSLIGGAGTTYNSSLDDKTYARVDGGKSSPGYFTSKV